MYNKGDNMENQEMEIWKDVKGWEGHVKVSNKGRVMTRDYFMTLEWKMRKPVCVAKGYQSVNVSHNGKSHLFKIHRLVAEAFIPNPDNLPQVNHKDENKANNCVDNLEWCDNYTNNHHGTKQMRVSLKQMKMHQLRRDFMKRFPYAVKEHGHIDWGKVLDREFNGDEKAFRKFLKTNDYSIHGITMLMKKIHSIKSSGN